MNGFTEYKIISFERTAFAHSLATTHYNYTLHNQGYGIYAEPEQDGAILEIGFVEQNPIILSCGSKSIELKENSIFIIPPNREFSVRAKSEELHRHTSAEFLIKCQTREVSGYTAVSDKTVVLPLVIEPTAQSSEIFSLIRSITIKKATQSDLSYFEQCSDFMALLNSLCELVKSEREADEISPSNRRYCDRAKAFISENMNKRLTVKNVADALSISKNYLTNIFSSGEGIGLMEYINRRKLSYMMELICRYGYSISAAGEQVGFTDANYISRIFRKYFGMTATEYKRNKLSAQPSFKEE